METDEPRTPPKVGREYQDMYLQTRRIQLLSRFITGISNALKCRSVPQESEMESSSLKTLRVDFYKGMNLISQSINDLGLGLCDDFFNGLIATMQGLKYVRKMEMAAESDDSEVDEELLFHVHRDLFCQFVQRIEKEAQGSEIEARLPSICSDVDVSDHSATSSSESPTDTNIDFPDMEHPEYCDEESYVSHDTDEAYEGLSREPDHHEELEEQSELVRHEEADYQEGLVDHEGYRGVGRYEEHAECEDLGENDNHKDQGEHETHSVHRERQERAKRSTQEKQKIGRNITTVHNSDSISEDTDEKIQEISPNFSRGERDGAYSEFSEADVTTMVAPSPELMKDIRGEQSDGIKSTLEKGGTPSVTAYVRPMSNPFMLHTPRMMKESEDNQIPETDQARKPNGEPGAKKPKLVKQTAQTSKEKEDQIQMCDNAQSQPLRTTEELEDTGPPVLKPQTQSHIRNQLLMPRNAAQAMAGAQGHVQIPQAQLSAQVMTPTQAAQLAQAQAAHVSQPQAFQAAHAHSVHFAHVHAAQQLSAQQQAAQAHAAQAHAAQQHAAQQHAAQAHAAQAHAAQAHAAQAHAAQAHAAQAHAAQAHAAQAHAAQAHAAQTLAQAAQVQATQTQAQASQAQSTQIHASQVQVTPAQLLTQAQLAFPFLCANQPADLRAMPFLLSQQQQPNEQHQLSNIQSYQYLPNQDTSALQNRAQNQHELSSAAQSQLHQLYTSQHPLLSFPGGPVNAQAGPSTLSESTIQALIHAQHLTEQIKQNMAMQNQQQLNVQPSTSQAPSQSTPKSKGNGKAGVEIQAQLHAQSQVQMHLSNHAKQQAVETEHQVRRLAMAQFEEMEKQKHAQLQAQELTIRRNQSNQLQMPNSIPNLQNRTMMEQQNKHQSNILSSHNRGRSPSFSGSAYNTPHHQLASPSTSVPKETIPQGFSSADNLMYLQQLQKLSLPFIDPIVLQHLQNENNMRNQTIMSHLQVRNPNEEALVAQQEELRKEELRRKSGECPSATRKKRVSPARFPQGQPTEAEMCMATSSSLTQLQQLGIIPMQAQPPIQAHQLHQLPISQKNLGSMFFPSTSGSFVPPVSAAMMQEVREKNEESSDVARRRMRTHAANLDERRE